MSAHDSTGATGAWGRGFTPFTQTGAPQQTTGGGSWRGAVAPTASTAAAAASAAAAPSGRWAKAAESATGAGAPSAASVPGAQSGSDDGEASARAWFDGHQQAHRKAADSTTTSAAAAAPASTSASTGGAWRSGRVDKLRGSGADPAADSVATAAQQPSAVHSTPAAHPAAPTAHTPSIAPNEARYEPSDFGNTHGLGDLKWYYLDPQRVTQGPFGASDMQVWYENSYFDLALPVQCLPAGADPHAPGVRFIPLGVWFANGNKAFLQTLPAQQAQKPGKGENGEATNSGAVESNAAAVDPQQAQLNGASSPVAASSLLAAERNANLSPVDEFAYAASVSQLVGDDDAQLSAADVTELERYNSNSQQQQQQQQQQQGASVAQGQQSPQQTAGLNPTAQPWTAGRAQASQQAGAARIGGAADAQPAAWSATNGVRGPSAPNGAPASLTSLPIPQSQQAHLQSGGLHSLAQLQAQFQQQQNILTQLVHQYQSFAPLTLDQLCNGLNLSHAQLASLTEEQTNELHARLIMLNHQRSGSQAHFRQQIGSVQHLITQTQQQMQMLAMQQGQQQQQHGGLTFQQQQQLLLMHQQQQQQQQLKQQRQQPAVNAYQQQMQVQQGTFDAFGRPQPFGQQRGALGQAQGDLYAHQQFAMQQQGGIRGAYGQSQLGEQNNWQQQQQAHLAPQHLATGNAFGYAPTFPSAPHAKMDGAEQMRDQFGNMIIGQQQQQQQPQQLHHYAQQAASGQQSGDLAQAVVYTPNQAVHTDDYQQIAQQQTPQAQQAPQTQATETAAPESAETFEEAAVDAQVQPVADEQQAESDEHAAEAEEEVQQQQQADDAESAPVNEADPADSTEAAETAAEDAAASAPTTAAAAPAATAAPAVHVAPWAAAAKPAEKAPVKSLLEIQQEEERAQQLRTQQSQQRQAASSSVRMSRALPLTTAWGGQSTPLTLVADESPLSASASAVGAAAAGGAASLTSPLAGGALLPTPAATTPSIKLLTPILATSAKPRQQGGKIGKNGRRTEPAIVQMQEQQQDAQPTQQAATPTASAPVAWGKATTGAAVIDAPASGSASAAAPVVSAWGSLKRPMLISPTSVVSAPPLLASPSASQAAHAHAGASAGGLTVLNPPLLTIRPRSMQQLDASGQAAATKPLNTVRILETQILDVQPTSSSQRKQSGRGSSSGLSGSSASSSRQSGSGRDRRGSSTQSSSQSASLSSRGSGSVGAAAAVDSSSSAFGGPSMSADFERWCQQQLQSLSGDAAGDFAGLTQFLMTLQSDEEVRQYIREYVGTNAQTDEFADGFLQLRAFESGTPKDSSSSKANDEDDKAEKKRRRKKNHEF